MRRALWLPVILLIASTLSAQQAFDVASVRQNLAGEDTQGPDKPRVNFPIGSDDAFYNTRGVFSAINLPLTSYLIFAFKINNNNRQALMDSAPDWVKSEHYNIEARTDLPNVTKDRMRAMMQTLLRDRFHLAIRRETEDVRVFAATLSQAGKTGPRLRQHSSDAICPEQNAASGTAKPAFDADGFPNVCGRFVNFIQPTIPAHRRFGGGNLPLPTILASFAALANLSHPVVDRTGLTGKFDYTLEYLPDPEPGKESPADAEGPTFIEAVRSQLGLKLVADKAPIEFIRIDHIEHPTPN